MLRRVTLMLAALAALVPTVAAAGTIPSHINRHNGYIEVRNEIVHKGTMGDFHFEVYLLLNGQRIQHLRVAPGQTAYFNHCCILAGTLYSVEIDLRGKAKAEVRPQLCNVRGIPFGYAVIVFTGHIMWDRQNQFTSSYQAHVPAVPCPTS